MSESNITKHALANSLRELMEEYPFEKISVSQICDRCNMNRKSFYYHFKDKFDLLNWIADIDFISYVKELSQESIIENQMNILYDISKCIYENQNFYRNAMNIEGQNSIWEHLRENFDQVLRLRLSTILGDDVDTFTLNFYVDTCLGAMKRWVIEENCIPPEEFVEKVRQLFQNSAKIFGEVVHQTE